MLSGATIKNSFDSWVQCIDCRKGMTEVVPQSVSLILTDPPYFLDGMDDNWDTQRIKSRLKKGVIGGIPVGMKFDRAQGHNLYRFLKPIAEQWFQILKPGGFVLCFSHPRLSHRAALAIEDAGFEIRDMLAWRYEGQAKAFTQDHFVRKSKLPEDEKKKIIKALGGRKTPQLKPQMELIILAQSPREGTFVDNWLLHQTGLIDVSDPVVEKERFPGTVIPVSKPRERFGHIAAKPVPLLRHLVRIFSAEGSIVCDPFAGSGSTGIAARLEGRDFFGFEIDSEIAAIADARVQVGTN